MVYSHSQLKTFDECQLRYRYKYLDKVPEPQVAESPALKFWSIIHASLELLYKKIQNSGQAPEKADLTSFFSVEMAKFRDQYNQLSEAPFPVQDFDDRIALWQQMIDRFYDQYAPFTATKVNGLEQHINFDLPNWAKFRGIIDRLDFQGDTAIIVDYKTDKAIAPLETFAESYQQQLTTYAIWVMQQYSHAVKKIEGKLIYLRFQKEITREITSEMLEQAIQKITEQISLIEKNLFDYNMGNKEAFQAVEGHQCRRCAYHVLCPLFKHKFKDDEVIVSEIGETTIKKLIDKFYILKKQEKEIEDQLQGIKEFLEEYVQSHLDEGWKAIYGDQAQLRVDYKNGYNAKPDQKDAVKQFLIEHNLLNLMSMTIKTNELTTVLESDPELLSQLSNLIEFQNKVIVGWAKEKKE